MSSSGNSGAWAWKAAYWLLLAAACEREPVAATGPKSLPSLSSAPPASAALAASVAPVPEPEPACPKFPDPPNWGHGSEQTTITLSPPVESRTVELRGEGVRMIFGFQEFLRAAECLNQKLVVDYLKSRPESEHVVDMSEQQGQKLIVPAAALLDVGHARVVASASGKPAQTIVKSFWTWMGCGGGCRHIGRDYRLRIPGYPFFQITDSMAHRRPTPADTDETKAR